MMAAVFLCWGAVFILWLAGQRLLGIVLRNRREAALGSFNRVRVNLEYDDISELWVRIWNILMVVVGIVSSGFIPFMAMQIQSCLS